MAEEERTQDKVAGDVEDGGEEDDDDEEEEEEEIGDVALPKVKTEEEDEAVPTAVVLGGGPQNHGLMFATAANNNGEAERRPAKAAKSCFLHIVKEEPPDEDDPPPINFAPVASFAGVSPSLTTRENESSAVKNVSVDSGIVLANTSVVEDDYASASIKHVSVEGGIIIKTEPRVLDDGDEEDRIDVDDGELSDEDDDSFDEECEFEDDDGDEDFEIDSSETADTPEWRPADRAKRPNPSSNAATGDHLAKRKRKDIFKEDRGRDEDDEGDGDTSEEGSFDFNGMTIRTVGNYSVCPKCGKNIKSTFIIRHIKLHDAPPERYVCPEEGCDLQVNRINNLFRHLREIHKSKFPYVCKRQKDCKARFARAQQLKAHTAAHRAERRRAQEEKEAAEEGSNDGVSFDINCMMMN